MTRREERGTTAAAVSLDEVGLFIGDTTILEKVTWRVEPGEKWIVLGPNGSGKSSLLRLLSGFGYPSRGTMEVLGGQLGLTDLRLLRKNVGWVHGDLAVDIPHFMTCLDVVLSGAEGSLVLYEERDGEQAERARQALAAIGASGLAERRFASLSTGERQRVLIARALAAQPRLLLLDEPCQGLDPMAREGFLESLSELLKLRRDLTAIAVTHHVEEIVEGFDRLLLIAGGRIVAAGPIADVMTERSLSRIFGERCRLDFHDGRYAIRFAQSRVGGAG